MNNTPTTKPTKALVAAATTALVAGLIVLWAALDAQGPAGEAVNSQEWVQIALALLGAPAAVGGATYKATNKPKPRRRP